MRGKAEINPEDCPMGDKCPMKRAAEAIGRTMLELEEIEVEQPMFALDVREDPEGIEVDPEAVRRAVMEAVGTEITRTFNRLRGRVD